MSIILSLKTNNGVYAKKISNNILNLLIVCSKIIEIPLAIKYLTTIQRLYLRSNCISIITPEICGLCNLTVLSLANNNITIIPPEIKNLTKMRQLNLSFNKITSIPPEIKYLTELVHLLLNNNSIETFPPELNSLTKLTKLLIYGQRIIKNYEMDISKGELRQVSDVKISKSMDATSSRNSLISPRELEKLILSGDDIFTAVLQANRLSLSIDKSDVQIIDDYSLDGKNINKQYNVKEEDDFIIYENKIEPNTSKI